MLTLISYIIVTLSLLFTDFTLTIVDIDLLDTASNEQRDLQIFTKYEQHRRLLLEDILASIARIPSSKHNLRSFQLNSDQHIQMLTALVLQLVQCVVTLPESLCKTQDKTKEKEQGETDSKKVS